MMIGLISGRLLQFSVFIYTQYLTISGVLRGALGIGQFTLVFQQTMNLASSAEAILSQYSSMSIRIKYIDKFFEFMNMKPLITTNTKDITTIPNEPTPTQIEFVDVSFRYPGTEINILHNFNMKINSGEKIALVGENGAGKSTIIKLILRFYDVTEGKILLNGTDIKNVDLGKWRTSVGALFQDFIKYQFTFKENIVLGNTRNQNNKDLMNEVVEKAGIEECLQNLPNGYQQVVGKMFDGGMDLSGGQWQKLALARAFYRDAPILILDEPTSAIDAKAEYEIFERVQKLQDNKTVIIISHRFSTVRNADRILVLNGGKIIEEGDHQQLLAKDGVYAELFNLQAKGYK
ncbi:MAG: ABC transporter ATP-binding protein [Chloroflexota bacterium]